MKNGGVGERLKPAVLKTVRLERVSGVRIPPPPPLNSFQWETSQPHNYFTLMAIVVVFEMAPEVDMTVIVPGPLGVDVDWVQ